MEARNCPRCKRVFNYIRNPVCPACEKEEEETFHRIKQFLDDNPMCNMKELAEGTDVSVKRLTQYIRDGRLEISKGMVGEIRCDQCGAPISRGRYCETCALTIQNNVKNLFRDNDLKKKGNAHQMHTMGQN